MKYTLYFLMSFYLISCSKDNFDTTLSYFDNPIPKTRSITLHNSYNFNWEDTTQIKIPGLAGLTTLP